VVSSAIDPNRVGEVRSDGTSPGVGSGRSKGLGLISLVAVMTLMGGCWQVAGPLIGLGAVGGGAAVATNKTRTKADSNPTASQQGKGLDATPVARSSSSQAVSRASEPVAARLPTSTPVANSSPSAAVEEASPQKPDSRRRADIVAGTPEPERSSNARPVVIAKSLSDLDDLPPTMIVL
jgi:hypothetical protein